MTTTEPEQTQKVYKQLELPFSTGTSFFVDQPTGHVDFRPEEFLISIHEIKPPYRKHLLNAWLELPPPLMALVNEVAIRNPAIVNNVCLEMADVVAQHEEFAEVLTVSEFVPSYCMRDHHVHKRIVHKYAKTPTFVGLEEDVQITGKLAQNLEVLTEEQLLFLEKIARCAVFSQLIGYSARSLSVITELNDLYMADAAREYPTRYIELALPFFLSICKKWWRGNHKKDAQIYYFNEVFQQSTNRDLISGIWDLYTVRKFFSSKEITGLSEGYPEDWRMAAKAGDIVEALAVEVLRKNHNVEKLVWDFGYLFQRFYNFFPLLSEWSNLRDRSVSLFHEGGILHDIVVHTAIIFGRMILFNQQGNVYFQSALYSVEDDFERIIEFSKRLPTTKGSTLTTLVKEINTWEIVTYFQQDEDSRPFGYDWRTAENTLAGWLLNFQHDTVVRGALLFMTLSRLARDKSALPDLKSTENEIFTQVRLSDPDESETTFGKMDVVVIDKKDLKPTEERTSSLESLIDVNTPAVIDIYEIKSSVSTKNMHKRRKIEQDHYNQVAYYIKSIWKKYPKVIIRRAAVIYIDPVYTQVMDVDLQELSDKIKTIL